MNANINKRGFMKMAAGGAAAFPAIIPASVLGQNGNIAPSNQVTVGLIGCGRRSGVGGEYNMVKQSKLVAVCDPVRWRREAKAKEWNVPDAYNDFRDVLARDDIDAVKKRTQPVSTLHSAIRSDIICHMGDLCVRTGKTLGWDADKETVTGCGEAVKMMHRSLRDPWTL